jgi:transposase-like protein
MASAAHNEAQALFALLARGETIEGVRRLIGTATPDRLAVLRCFDAILIRHGLLQFTRRPTHSQQHTCVARRHRSRSPVHEHGRSRRFSQAEREAIQTAIRGGLRPGEIRRQFSMSEDTLLKIRRAMGLYRDRRFKPTVNKEVQAKVLQLLPTCSVARIAETLGLSKRRVRVIAKTVGGAAALKTSGCGRRIRGEFRKQILASLQAGMRPVLVKRNFGVSIATILLLRRSLGDERDRRPASMCRNRSHIHSP